MSDQDPHALSDSFHSMRPVSRLTHNFYRYPARFSDVFARDVIGAFTEPGQIVMDPFAGGGTSIVEALAAGRYSIGIDINSLACFVTGVKTTPLSGGDRFDITRYLESVRLDKGMRGAPIDLDDRRSQNLPSSIRNHLGNALSWVELLLYPRQRRFIRCALLRAAQQALDCRDELPDRESLLGRIRALVSEMYEGLDELVHSCQSHGIAKNCVTSRRLVAHRTAVGLDLDGRLRPYLGRVSLVLTSPPYPKVHVLYHRWQIRGRKETPAPYWIADLNDGQGSKYYTFGSRTPLGLRNYFATATNAFRSLRPFLQPDAHVVQLLGFSEPGPQLPAYLGAMSEAGYRLIDTQVGDNGRLPWRRVPNRKWYSQSQPSRNTSAEVLLIHQPTSTNRTRSRAPDTAFE